MVKKGLIAGVLLANSYGAAVQAQSTPCQTVDQILATAATIRRIQADENNRDYSDNMLRLEQLSESISLAGLIPQNQSQSLSSEVATLFAYLSTIREGVAGAKSGYETYAKESLNNGITPEFTRTINSLGAFWSCRPDDIEFDTDGTISNDRSVRTRPSEERAGKGHGAIS